MTRMPETLVHLLATPDAADLDLLESILDPAIRVTVGSELPDPPAFEVLVAGRPSRDQLAASRVLGWLVVPYAGIPPETSKLLADFPRIRVHNLHHNSPAAAEMAIGLLLAAAKMLIPMDTALRKGRWSGRGRDNPSVLLAGKTALVVGYGSIGRRVASACRALGMEVVATRRRGDGARREDGAEVRPAAELPALLPRATALIVTVPLTAETRGLIGDRELSLLPRGAVLVNVSRGPVVDERALYDALATGRLHSAGIDVWYRYPGRDGDPDDTPPSTLPFHELPNVVMSPHRGGWLHEVEAHRMRHLAAVLNAIARGEEPPHAVDLAAGY
jgi:phosphoglycerate dehydrogenase-like enzyme